MGKNLRDIQKFFDAGAEVTGAAVGGALGFLAGGPGTAAGQPYWEQLRQKRCKSFVRDSFLIGRLSGSAW